MNIDEYRAMIAAEKEQAANPETPATPEQPPVAPVMPVTPVAPIVDNKPVEVELDGEKYTVEQLREFKSGFMRTKDYTQKTQETAQLRREAQEALRIAQQVNSNPQLAQQLGITPRTQEAVRAEQLEDQLVQREVEMMTLKYPDFNVQEALNLASSKPGLNLEDAHLLIKSRTPASPPAAQATPVPVNIEELKKEWLREIEATNNATQSIISSNDSALLTTSQAPPLNEAEKEYCRRSGTNPEEYVKMKQQLGKRK